jgi:hypothetical protein
MRPAPSDENNTKKPAMIPAHRRSMPSGSDSNIIIPIRTMTFVICVLSAVQAIVYPGMTRDAWAGPEETVPAITIQGAPEGQPVPSDPAQPLESKEPAASLPQEKGKQTVPSMSVPPQTGPTATAPVAPAAPSRSGNEEDGFVDALHGGISRGFLSSAVWLDSFFGDERYESEINRSQLKVRFDAFREGGGGMNYLRPNFDLRLVLPQLRHKTRLVVSGDPNVDIDAVAQPGTPTNQFAKGQDKSVTTALQVVPLDTKRSNLSIRAGIKFHSGKLELMLGPRYRYLVHLGPWDARFTQEELWTTDIGFQVRTRFDLERSLSHDLFFRTSLEGLWSEKVDGYPYALSFLLRQPLDGNRAIQYEWVNSFQTRPTDLLTEELIIFRYRQRFWRDWLFLEIAPQVRFPRDRSFEYLPGILFRLEMVFGDIQNIF